ncbi:hypothetical protein NADE_008312 [Nannochloris sp. 'desiccata']|nr:hypothetical protein NADE_008312 [Chlorella desiccata (nom. nud.)]
MTSIAALRGSSLFRAFRSSISEQTAIGRRLFASQLKDPPGMFATIGAMGAGAGGAVLIAGVGVYAVFQMAFWIAGSTGRSLNGEANKAKIDNTAASSINSADNSGGSPKVASSLEKLALNPNSRR